MATANPARGNDSNIAAWDDIASYWDQTLGDGNDLYQECILPVIRDLGHPQEGERALDLGTGSAVIAAVLAAAGAIVTAADGSKGMLDKAEARAKRAGLRIKFEMVDLLDAADLDEFAGRHERFDIVTCSMTLKELSDLEPLAAVLPKLLKPNGRVVIVNLHPVFSKPAGHRAIEVFEDSATGKQEIKRHMKVPQYLNVAPGKSEALRGQPQPLVCYGEPSHARSAEQCDDN